MYECTLNQKPTVYQSFYRAQYPGEKVMNVSVLNKNQEKLNPLAGVETGIIFFLKCHRRMERLLVNGVRPALPVGPGMGCLGSSWW